MMDNRVRISRVAKELGVSSQHIRMLEWQGRIPPARRDYNGRIYTEFDIALLRTWASDPGRGGLSVQRRFSVPEPIISYAPRRDATPEAEVSALAACYRIILDSAKTRGPLPDKSGPDDPERRSNEIRAKASIP